MARPRPVPSAWDVSGEFSCTQDEWRQHHRGGDMLLEGLVSLGYVLAKGGRFAVSMAGRRRLEAVERNPLEEEAGGEE